MTKSIEEIVRDEVTRAIEKHAENITSSNTNQIFKYTTNKSKVTWVVQCCAVCRKPNFMHQNPLDEHCDVDQQRQLAARWVTMATGGKRRLVQQPHDSD